MSTGADKINFNAVCKSFKSSGEILKNLNFKIQEGEFVVLLGGSGSGKSTILRLIAGLDTPTSGTMNFHNTGPFDRSFVFQESHLMPWRTVLENVELPLELMNESEKSRKEKAEEALKLVQLAGHNNLLPSELSGGMKMRASLARALTGSPSLLLLDEPFAALDESIRFKLAEDLRELWLKKKMTIVFVTHSVQEACFLGNRIIILSERPATIQNDITLNLPKTRTAELRTSVAFNDELKKMYQLIGNGGDRR